MRPLIPLAVTRLRRRLAVGVAAFVAVSAHAALPAYDDQWHFAITPYLWGPGVDIALKYSLPPGSGGSAESEADPDSYLDNLQFALMVNGEARRNEWAISSDFIYLDFGKQDSTLKSVGGRDGAVSVPRQRNVDTDTDLKGWTWSVLGSYTFWRSERAYIDVLSGVRLLHLEAGTDWSLDGSIAGNGFTFSREGSISDEETLVDAVIGLRGRATFGDGGKWFVPYYVDAGAGDDSTTWQALVGIGYTFGWGDTLLAWRELAFDQSSDKLIQDLQFSGPALGATWRF